MSLLAHLARARVKCSRARAAHPAAGEAPYVNSYVLNQAKLWQLSCSFFLEHLWQGLSSESYLCDNSYSYELWHQHEIRKGKSIVCRQENTGTTQVCVCAHGFINSFLSARRWYFSTASHNLAHTLPAARCHTPTVSTSIVPGPSFSDQWPSDSWFVLRQLHHWCCTQSFGFVRYASFFRPKTQRPSFRFSKEPLSTRWPLITPGQSLTLYGGFLKSGYPHSWMVYKYNGKIHSNGWFGGPLFQETSICLERIWKEYTHLSSWHGSSSSTKFRLGTCILHPAAFLSVRALKQHCSENEANSNA